MVPSPRDPRVEVPPPRTALPEPLSTDADKPRPRWLLRAAWPLLLAFAFVLALRLWLELVGPLPTERWSLRFTPWPPRPQPSRDIGDFFELLGTPLFAGVTMVVTLWLVWRGLGLRAAAFVLVCVCGLAVEDVLKLLLGPTPLWSAARGAQPDPANYPSGHVVYAVVLAGSLAILAAHRSRWDLVALAVASVVLMGPSRVWMGSHLPSDVLAGYVFGLGWLVSAARLPWFRRVTTKPPEAEGRKTSEMVATNP